MRTAPEVIKFSSQDMEIVTRSVERSMEIETAKARAFEETLPGKSHDELMALLNQYADAAVDFEIFVNLDGGSFSSSEAMDYEQAIMRRNILHDLLGDAAEPVRLRIVAKWDAAEAVQE